MTFMSNHRPGMTLVAMFALGAVSAALAGDLVPPFGPITGTMKTLVEVEPRIAVNATNTPGDATAVFRITQAGSYYLAGNVTGVSGKHGIVIAASSGSATLDLNGFSIVGVPGSLIGVVGVGNTSIHNGDVRSWGSHGVSIGTGLVERIHTNANGDHGIRVTWGSLVRHCRNELNGDDGISAADTTRIEDCFCKNNGGWGIRTDGACAIEKCLAYNNSLGGIDGGMSTTIRDCQLFSNPGPGVQAASDCLIVNNNLSANGKGVFVTGSRCRIEGNNATACGKGYDIDGTGNIIVKNTAKGSTTINYEFPLGIQNTVGQIVTGAIVLDATNSSAWANFEF